MQRCNESNVSEEPEEKGSFHKMYAKCPYLLIDVRLQDEFDIGHIIRATNYPTRLLGRSFNYETPEMFAYKNKPGFIIIIYDNDETLAPKAATTLVERGYENVLMLSGGLKVCWKKFPRGLIAGRIPEHLKEAILSTCGMSASRRSRYDPTSDLASDLSRKISLSTNETDNQSITSTSNFTCSTMRSRYSSRRRYEAWDFEPYCASDARKGTDDKEEFTQEDLTYLSMSVNSESH
ncbi:Centrosomal protein of 41 kDa [Cichlidogyrus casuarinus]|uniref:Centrosomal protein of 41 kDa n=1 Tax=Cichlidogyrus casuarinus TaxID=1844966 RepID=A0ABD2PPL8_9PLAT